MTGPVPARVDAQVKDVLLGLLDHAVGQGWPVSKACQVLGLDPGGCTGGSGGGIGPTWVITVPAAASTPFSRMRSTRSWRCSTRGGSGTGRIGG